MTVLAGCGFFTVGVLSWRGPVTYYVLFFLHLESRRVHIGGITKHPDQEWMEQIGRAPRRRPGVIFIRPVMCCMIATGSSAHRFGPRSQAVA
ncbi:MAG: Integrase, catalytic region [Bryobacterales bacterium]|nr:Integrase, catalytic region [Bryobacterales bacterium]